MLTAKSKRMVEGCISDKIGNVLLIKRTFRRDGLGILYEELYKDGREEKYWKYQQSVEKKTCNQRDEIRQGSRTRLKFS